jgi:hypothetical protein
MRSVATLTAALVGLLLALPAQAQTPTQTLSGVLTGTRTLSASEVYLIDGEVYVDNGATLIIPAGTVLKGKQTPTTGNGVASVLVVQRGGRIEATGSATQPIIFTAEADNVADAFDTNESQKGLWGGVVLLGNATNNRGVRTVEGIPATIRTSYGCGDTAFPTCDDNDDSGIFRYVSIRHAGFTLTPDAEINGLTMGGVGRNTTVEYVEVFANSDDSFEWFGGTVNAKYLVAAFSGDDEFDWDTGWTGRGQFWYAIKAPTGETGRCFESDGAASPFTATPLSSPTISNLTCNGSGVGSTPGGSDAGSPAFLFRENTQGLLYNSVVSDWFNLGVSIEDTGNPATSSRQRFEEGALDLRNNLFWAFGVGSTFPAITAGSDAALETALAARNQFADPGLVALSRVQNRGLDPRPAPGALAASGADFTLAGLNDPFFTPVGYRGAFAPGAQGWATGWTALDQMAYLAAAFTPAAEGPEGEAFSLSVGPNPAASAATVRFSLDRAQAVRLTLHDVLGREVLRVADGTLAAGAHEAALGLDALPAGVYVLRLQGDGAAATQRLSVVR